MKLQKYQKGKKIDLKNEKYIKIFKIQTKKKNQFTYPFFNPFYLKA